MKSQTIPKRPTELASCIQGEGGIKGTGAGGCRSDTFYTETVISSKGLTGLYCYFLTISMNCIILWICVCLTMDPRGNLQRSSQ